MNSSGIIIQEHSYSSICAINQVADGNVWHAGGVVDLFSIIIMKNSLNFFQSDCSDFTAISRIKTSK